jgi:spermidine synthase
MINLRSIAYILFFFSGFSALVYQVVWARQLAWVFGSTTESVGIVLATFMAGMALGGLVLGRTADQVKSRFLLFAALEGGVGLYAIAASFGYGLLEEFCYSGGAPDLIFKILLAAVYLIIPCFLIGGTLPTLSRFCLEEKARNFGLTAGGLYANNTLGAAAGAVVTGFFLLEHLGASRSILAAGLVNLAVAATAVALELYNRKMQGAEAVVALPEKSEDVPAHRPFMRLIYFTVFFLAGTSTMAHELVWTRILSQYFKNSVYSFAAMLMAVLLALAAGSGAGTWIVKRVRNAGFMLGLLQLLAGLASLVTVVLFITPYTDVASYQQLLLRSGAMETLTRFMLFEIAAAMCLIFLPAFFMGMSFPFMAALTWRPVVRFAGYMGDLQFVLTAGNVTGALLVAFFLIPLYTEPDIGIMKSLFFGVGANLLAGMILLAAVFARIDWIRRGLATTAAAGLLGLAGWLYFGQPDLLLFWKSVPEGEDRIFYRSGKMGEVAVVQGPEGLILKVNNTSGLGGTGGEYLETRLGMMPFLLARGSERALVMGLGTGNTLNGLLNAGAKDVDCVEIIPEVVTASTAFHTFDPRTLTGGRLRIIFNDARTYLRCVDDRYDLIVGDLYFPWQAEAGFMYTREHFERVRDRLTEDGVFFQWLPLHQLRWEDFGVIGYTFSDVFPHVAVFLASTDVAFPIVGLMGSNEPFRLDPVRLQAELDAHFQQPVLKQFGMDDALALVTLYFGNEWLFRTKFSEVLVNTEDRTCVEYRSAKVLESHAELSITNFRRLADPQFKDDAVPVLDLPEMEAREKVAYEEKVRNCSEALKHYLFSWAIFLREDYLRRMGAADSPEERKKIREVMGQETVKAFGLAPDLAYVERNFLRLWHLYISEHEITAANNLLVYGITTAPDRDDFYNKLGLGLMLQGKYAEAQACLAGALEKNAENHSARANLAIAEFLVGDRVKAREDMAAVIEEVGYEKLAASKLTVALAVLILKGEAEARPLLDPLLEEATWKDLIEAALKSARESGVGDG